MDTTAKGFPFSEGSDGPSSIDDTMRLLAEYVDGLYTSLTTSERDLLPDEQKWDGRRIFNRTTRRQEWWDLPADKWRPFGGDDDAFMFSMI